MRLLSTTTFKLHEFPEDDPPFYAILLHRREEDEVTFQDIVNSFQPSGSRDQKLLEFCREAAVDGYEYCWIDTCCIDKTSSAELSKARNSMYRWYQQADLCYVYLMDVNKNDDLVAKNSWFRTSSWFTRGWTLQELLAPPAVFFYDKNWQFIGSRDTLSPIISQITQIDLEYLSFSDLSDCSIAQRMSWASHRQTTRIEDKAYYLRGIFGTNMPLLYGEGNRAFRRLQEELLGRSEDHSIFANSLEHLPRRDCLADDPSAFKSSGDIQLFKPNDYQLFKPGPFNRSKIELYSDRGASLTSRGIEITLAVLEQSAKARLNVKNQVLTDSNCVLALLSCGTKNCVVALPLWESYDGSYYRRNVEYELIPIHELHAAKVQASFRTVTLSHRQLGLQRSWNEGQARSHDVIVKYATKDISGFAQVWKEPEDTVCLRDDIGEEHLSRKWSTYTNRRKMTFLQFSDDTGWGFCISLMPRNTSLKVTLYTNTEGSLRPFEVDALMRERTGLFGDHVSAQQWKEDREVTIRVVTRRGAGRWVVHVSMLQRSKTEEATVNNLLPAA